jgi:cytochrome d ubiquinol oxidase subunit II
MHPDLILGELSLAAAAAPRATVVAYLAVLPAGALILLPSLWALFRTFAGRVEVGEVD